jgi:hypothetical protein
MFAIPAIALLAGAVLCLLVGRFLLIKGALGIGRGWLATVLFVPFGPVIFAFKYPEPARSTQLWRHATAFLFLLFFLDGGNVQSLYSLKDFGKSGAVVQSAGDTHFHLPAPGKLVAATVRANGTSLAAGTPVKPKVAPPTTPAPTPTPAPATPAHVATPSPAAAAVAQMPPAPKVLTPSERIQANRQEFERLAEWYDNLKHEHGYLRKHDVEAIDAYNAEVRRYQTALQLAKNEQIAVSRLTAQK